MTSIELVTLGEVADLQWGDTSVTKKSYVLTGGKYPAYSASGQDGFLPYFDYDRTGVILSAIGANAGKTWLATGKWSCIKNTIRFFSKDESVADTRYLYWATQSHATFPLRGSAQPFISQGDAREVAISLPPIPEQRAIAATLGALDDKIESNRRQRHLLRELGIARYQASIRDGSRSLQLSAATVSIARGVAPKYADEDLDAALVINQKCIRDGWVSLAPSRRMHDRTVKPEKRASAGDILVNSTGTGTLGRIARWHAGEIFVDGHVSVVKADRSVISPTVLAYSLLGREADIEGLETGSTGQTELSAARLGELNVILPPTEQGSRLETTLIAIENRCDQLAAENTNLESTRDALLPALLSGSIRVPAEGVEA